MRKRSVLLMLLTAVVLSVVAYFYFSKPIPETAQQKEFDIIGGCFQKVTGSTPYMYRSKGGQLVINAEITQDVKAKIYNCILQAVNATNQTNPFQ